MQQNNSTIPCSNGERKMATYHLTTPLTEEVVRKLYVRDIVFLNGTLFGIRDLTQIRIFDHKMDPPVSLQGAACIHTAPSLKKEGDRWEKICVGTTTSGRMDRFTPGPDGKIRRAGDHRQGRPVPGQSGSDEEIRGRVTWPSWAGRLPWRQTRSWRWRRSTGKISIPRPSTSSR